MSIGRDGDGERSGFSGFSLRATKCQASAQPVRCGLFEKERTMIDPPTETAGTLERKVELDQTIDYAIQLLLEEAHTLGWQRVEFLTAVMDSANNQLSALEEERELEVAPPLPSS